MSTNIFALNTRPFEGQIHVWSFFKNILSTNSEFMKKLLGLFKLWIDYFFELWGVTSQILAFWFTKCNISNLEKQVFYIVKHKPSHRLEKLFNMICKDSKIEATFVHLCSN